MICELEGILLNQRNSAENFELSSDFVDYID